MQKPAECTTILVGKDATIDGSTMIARSEDGGSTIIPEAFIAVNPKEQPKHYKAVISGQEIDDEDLLPNPLRYTSVPDASGKNGIWAAAGINDATVAMTATETITTNSRIQGIDPLVEEGGLGKEDFVTLTLPYIHSAREGVKRLGYLVEKYGTYEMNGSAFADHDEVWYIETIGGHHWAARRIPDDAYVAAPNRLNIDFFDFNDEENFMCSSDLLDIINEYHLNPDYQGYNLRHIFGSSTIKDAHYNNPRAWYIHRYFDPEWEGEPGDQDQPFITYAKKKISPEDIKFLESSHYQDTKYDVYSTTNTEAEKKLFRPIGINRNFETHILQIRNDVEEGIAGVQWLAFGPNTFNCFVPFYTNVTTTPASFQTGPDFDLTKIFWLNKLNAQLGDTNYKVYSALEQAFEEKTMAKLRQIENETDRAVKGLTGRDLQEKLEEANQKMADLTYKQTAALTGEMVKDGHSLMKLKYDLLD
ncbi:dipeptidase [Lactobacillus delbrueckii subsp. bulgaricus]|uniref:Dipeptidase n=1 Tax=Lactobacillus delbrueckii subsp. bulgaricus (strain ATCC 11842 / DSM 20081 / BCRC 10696 / JCM 1002 / NBRC 13953 / NCIMB 11778 / NCTC 12712 / WDCM 00102 / Lb 14) TaxID=390333 RepID=Q1GBC6_LACDA|nr:C69 family dipeptidase [Lactobacillus delbrueckii]KRN39219.1 dipeptidase [Lactobacillus delbrueckii subsp. bulgaricus ATCC 11842 = JCM 1002]MDG9748283.1 C69 family dipeptidase [Lactobacillus delbrueckii subsp. bulgaricus ATCC 11842 = JCM 1002]GEB90309.1 dipeptidase [Lactobacillus delbrueckii subsp. bulgaricus]CAI97342.1 Dipeptidase [Lactobacillus delbrueckii subsp. bulgaricus ATCC 11842 = JCM 1002]